MTDISPLVPALPGEIDGFRVEIDPAHERGDIVLDRPPLNVITMAEREQLRVAFEVLDADPGVRVIVLRAVGEHFSSGGEIGGFLEAFPEHVSRLAWNIAAPARCSKPIVAVNRVIVSGSASNCRWPAISASPPRAASMRCRNSVWRRSQVREWPRACRRWSASAAPRTSSCVRVALPAVRPATVCIREGELEAAADALVDELRAFAPLAQRAAKKLLKDIEDASLSLAIELEGQCYGRLQSSEDFREGAEAFAAKRPQNFRGR